MSTIVDLFYDDGEVLLMSPAVKYTLVTLLVQTKEGIDTPYVRGIMLHVLEGLHYLHAKGISHGGRKSNKLIIIRGKAVMFAVE